MIATDVAARGLHVDDITHVINFDPPHTDDDYVHRVGRTGRAGERGVASTLFGREQRTELFQLERTLGIRMERLPLHDMSLESGATARTVRERVPAASRCTLIRLPGEVLQAQMDN
jgi:superfamily II DNA/RNA helicase